MESHSLWQTPVGELIKNQVPISIDSELEVEAAAEILVKNGISSAPVYSEKTKTFVGMFDYQDLVSYLLLVFRKNEWLQDEENVEIREIIRRALRHEPVTVKLVSDLSQRNPFYSVMPESTLENVLDVMGRGVHRVACVDGAGKLVGVVTQSNVANFLFGHGVKKELPFGDKPLSELSGVVQRRVLPVNAESQVFEAMALMNKAGYTSLPLVDHTGRLVGSISLSDIKYVLRGFKYNMLWNTCFSFISFVRKNQGIVEFGGQDRFPFFDVKSKDTLWKAIGKMVATKAHRVWVTDDDNKLTGVVSLTDALRAIYYSSA